MRTSVVLWELLNENRYHILENGIHGFGYMVDFRLMDPGDYEVDLFNYQLILSGNILILFGIVCPARSLSQHHFTRIFAYDTLAKSPYYHLSQFNLQGNIFREISSIYSVRW